MTVITFSVPMLRTITAHDFLSFLAFLELVYDRRPRVYYDTEVGLLVSVVTPAERTDSGVRVGARTMGLEFHPKTK